MRERESINDRGMSKADLFVVVVVMTVLGVFTAAAIV